jgi:hypothetical protein
LARQDAGMTAGCLAASAFRSAMHASAPYPLVLRPDSLALPAPLVMPDPR